MFWTTSEPEASPQGYISTITNAGGNVSTTTSALDVNEHGASLATKVAALSLLPVVIICGLFGNVLVCRAVLRYQKLRCVANTFIVSLAVSDLAVCGIVMPVAAYQELTYDKQWHLGPALCNIWVALDVLLCTASIWNMCVIALDRCMAITNPVWYVNRRTPTMAAIAISAAWGLSLLLCVMVLFLMGENFAESTDYVCQVSPSPAIAVVSASVTFYIPCLIVVAVYLKIFLAARRHLRGKGVRAGIMAMRLARSSGAQCPVQADRKSSSLEINGNVRASNVYPACNDAKQDTVNLPEIVIDAHISSASSPPPSGTGQPVEEKVELHRNSLSVTSFTRNGKRTSFTVDGPETSYCDDDGYSDFDASEMNGDDNVPSTSMNYKESSSSSTAAAPTSHGHNNHAGQRGHHSGHHSNGHHSQGHSHGHRPRPNRISVTRERRAAAVLAVVIGVFICCWLPFFIVYVIVGLCPHCQVTNTTFQFLTWLGWCNSILNPLIYTIFNLDFRHAFRKILLQRPCS